MCCRALIVQSCCCCGLDIYDGALAWAIVDAILHLCLIPLPNAASELAPFAAYFVAWIGILILADIVLAFGCKAGLPGLLMGWMIVSVLNILVCITLWILIPVFFAIHSNKDISWDPITKSMSEIRSHGWWTFVFSASLTVVIVVPMLHSYLWLVVKSLRRRMLLQIAVESNLFNENGNDEHLTRTELALYKMIHGGMGENGRP